MKKQIIAILAAFAMTALVGLVMLVIGGAALLNKSGTLVSTSKVQAAQANAGLSQEAQIQQLQSLVAQYQSREKEYQSREQQYSQQLAQANAQIAASQQQMQQVQQLLSALQQRGLITVTRDGQIFINR